MGTVQLCSERVLLTVAAALRLQRCHGTLVYIWFASPPPGHTSGLSSDTGWSQAFPPGYSASQESWREREKERARESKLAAVDAARAEVRHGMNTSGHLSIYAFHLVWNDSSPAHPKEMLLPGHCIACYPLSSCCTPHGKYFLDKLSHFIWGLHKPFQLDPSVSRFSD